MIIPQRATLTFRAQKERELNNHTYNNYSHVI